MKTWCDVCLWPARRRWALVTRAEVKRGHKQCLSVVKDALDMPTASVLTRMDFSMRGAPGSDDTDPVVLR